jgi:hypothetical protein
MGESTVNDMMEAFAHDAVNKARVEFGYELDYSLESLRDLDLILERFHDDLPAARPSNEQIWSMAKLWGGYLGETMRRQWGGAWTIADHRFTLEIGSRACWPPARTRNAIENGPGDGSYAYAVALGEDLDVLAP